MHERVAEFVEAAQERYGLTPEVREFPEKGTPTAADAAAAVDCDVAQIVNSLVFSVDGEAVLLLTSGANRVDEAAVAEHFGVEEGAVGMAAPDLVKEATGWAIGGVPPICHATDVPAVIDPDLLDFETVWAAAGTPTSVWSVDPETLQALADAEAVSLTG